MGDSSSRFDRGNIPNRHCQAARGKDNPGRIRPLIAKNPRTSWRTPKPDCNLAGARNRARPRPLVPRPPPALQRGCLPDRRGCYPLPRCLILVARESGRPERVLSIDLSGKTAYKATNYRATNHLSRLCSLQVTGESQRAFIATTPGDFPGELNANSSSRLRTTKLLFPPRTHRKSRAGAGRARARKPSHALGIHRARCVPGVKERGYHNCAKARIPKRYEAPGAAPNRAPPKYARTFSASTLPPRGRQISTSWRPHEGTSSSTWAPGCPCSANTLPFRRQQATVSDAAPTYHSRRRWRPQNQSADRESVGDRGQFPPTRTTRAALARCRG